MKVGGDSASPRAIEILDYSIHFFISFPQSQFCSKTDTIPYISCDVPVDDPGIAEGLNQLPSFLHQQDAEHAEARIVCRGYSRHVKMKRTVDFRFESGKQQVQIRGPSILGCLPHPRLRLTEVNELTRADARALLTLTCNSPGPLVLEFVCERVEDTSAGYQTRGGRNEKLRFKA
jgi:hypothetical protein